MPVWAKLSNMKCIGLTPMEHPPQPYVKVVSMPHSADVHSFEMPSPGKTYSVKYQSWSSGDELGVWMCIP